MTSNIHICGDSIDMYLGPPPPERPRCGNVHRERFMKWYVRDGLFKCQKCWYFMTWDDNIAGDWNSSYRWRWGRFVLGIQREEEERIEQLRARLVTSLRALLHSIQ